MSRRVLVGFILLNIIVSLSVAVIIISYDRAQRPDDVPSEGPTQIVFLTATPQPGALQPQEYQQTIDAQQLTMQALASNVPIVAVVTATPGGAGIAVPDATTIATIDPALLPAIPTDLPPGVAPAAEDAAAGAVEDDGCIRHVVESGEFPITIAQQYGVLPGDLLTVNGLDEDSIIRVGDVLIIPVEGCAALITPTPIPSPTNTPFALTRAAPTSTLPPTAANAQVVIADVTNWGTVNSEMVELRNVGNAVNLQGWTLSSESGEVFVFPELRLQNGQRVRLYSRQGADTPAALYWGREDAAWAEGETITLADSAGQVQMVFRVGETNPLFQEATLSPGS
jgi:LysM repeat protein